MLEELFTWLTVALSGSYGIALVAALGWGVISILLSPCHLSSIPLVIGYISSQGQEGIRRSYSLSLVFGIGILITIGLIGVVTASLGRMMGDVGVWGNLIVAGVFFVVGLYLMDVITLSWSGVVPQRSLARGWKGAFLLGLIFGIGLGPCTFAYMAPVLGVAFSMATSNLLQAFTLVAAFGVGHCAVIVAAGTLTKKVQNYLNWSENSKTVSYIKKICGVLVILGGIYMIYNTF